MDFRIPVLFVSERLCPPRNSILDKGAYSRRTDFGESVRNALRRSKNSTSQLEDLKMKKLAFALAASAVLAGPAMAADMAVKAARPMAAPVIATNWTGCYFSGGVGYQFDRVRHEHWAGTPSVLR